MRKVFYNKSNETNTLTVQIDNCASSQITSHCARVDLFLKLTRDVPDIQSFEELIKSSWNEDAYDTIKIIFNARDCRGGKGYRSPFIKAMTYISNNYPEWFELNIKIIPEFGRWLDVIELYSYLQNDSHKTAIISNIVYKLMSDKDDMDHGNFVSLLSKWIPGEKKKWDRASNITDEICKRLFEVKHVNLNIYARYRKEYISPLRKYISLLEQKMCANNWDEISYSSVPSIAMKNYRKAFMKHSPERFQEWLDETKVAGQYSPSSISSMVSAYEIMRNTIDDDRYLIIEQPAKSI